MLLVSHRIAESEGEAVSRPLIKEVLLRNLLSFGPESEPVELNALNVLIGPNATGKSNLIEGLSLMAAAPSGVQTAIREGGGVSTKQWRDVVQVLRKGIKSREDSVEQFTSGSRPDLAEKEAQGQPVTPPELPPVVVDKDQFSGPDCPPPTDSDLARPYRRNRRLLLRHKGQPELGLKVAISSRCRHSTPSVCARSYSRLDLACW